MSGRIKSYETNSGTRWAYEFSLRDPATGKRKSESAGGFTSERAATKARNLKAAELETEGIAAVLRKPSTMALGEFLTTEWLPSVRSSRKPTTIYNYETLIRCYVAPHIGGVRLDRLTSGQLGELYQVLEERGGRGGRPLSLRSVHHVHQMLTTALGWAVKNGHLRSSPAAGVERTAPTRRASKLKHWTPSQVGQFIESTTSDRSRAMWLLALNTGVRRGEMAALRWSDLDVEQGILRVHRNLVTVGYVVVEGTVKTEESDREIELDGAVMAELAAHRSRQAAERLKWGPGWQGDRHDPRMFTREDGADFHPAAISHLLKVATVRAGLPRIGVHGLRHTSAVLAMRAGVPPKVVQHRLGHASIAITMDTYSHVIEGMQREASSAISAVMGLGS